MSSGRERSVSISGRKAAFSALAAAALSLAVIATSALAFPSASVSATGLTCFAQPATIVGTEGNDQLGGTPGPDVIVALGGDDKISAGAGRDLICSGSGADIVSAEGGSDSVSAGSEDDQVLGGNGIDRLIGGPAVDGCTGGVGKDVIRRCEGRARKSARLELQDESPVAVPDALSLTEDMAAATAQVVGNDTDSDNGLKAVQSVGRPQHGSATVSNVRTSVTYSPEPNFCGADSVSYALNGGSSATISISVACIDDPPVAIDDSFGLKEDDSSKEISVLINDHDVDAGPISIGSISDPSHGAAAIEGMDAILYTPNPDYCGADSFNYTLSGGSSATVSLEIACIDDAPSAVADSANLTEDDPSTAVTVLANDTDIDGDPLTVADKTEPAHGTVSIGAGGSGVAYAPVADYCGPDSFTYALNGGSTAMVSVSVACVDDAPMAVGDSVAITEGDTATAIAVLANDTDVDEGPRGITGVTQPVHGTAVVTGGGTGLTYEPDEDYCDESASDDFTYTLNGGSSATVAVSVACFEEAPMVEFTATPSLAPGFDRSVDDYYVECTGSPIDVSAEVGSGYTIAIDGQASATGTVETTVPLDEGEEFSFSVFRLDGEHKYFVRCLPSDFATWDFTRLAQPSHEFYVVVPTLGAPSPNYVVIFDDNGVPVWWYKTDELPFDARIMPAGTIGWTQEGSAEIRELDGTFVRSQSTLGYGFDIHELVEMPNGNLILLSYPTREHVDLTAYGGGADDSVQDALIQEIDPLGELVWEWNSKDHIGLEETGRWYSSPQSTRPGGERDIVHINAVEPDGDDAFLISMRHTDAVYKIDRDSGDVVWKLGGTETPQSLEVLDDPQASYPFGGQHDVRLQPDGTITVYDNNTGLVPVPRAVRYEVDEGAGTATLLEAVIDPLVTASFCCGSARRSADGSWLMSWGGQSLVTEFDSEGNRTFKLSFGPPLFSYRAQSVPDGLIDIEQLRGGMDSMNPR
jgi:arylsulfotransferase ASST/Big-like domain-containing protein/hemolysin type calcium-binding protein